MNAQTKISSRGQVVIPKDVRDRLQWAQGQAIDIVETPDGLLLKRSGVKKTMTAAEALEKIRSTIRYEGPSVTIEDMNHTIAEGWLQSALKSDCAQR